MKILIAYYSRRGQNYVGGDIVDLKVGNTEVAAGMIQKLTGGDTFRIETVKTYPADYQETTEVSQQELRQKARPELTSHVGNMSAYDAIVLGYQTRKGLDARMRELVTFSMLLSLGGCEPQLKGHVQGNVSVGNDKKTLVSVVTQLLPYVGYPRTLNALRCINEVLPETP